MSNYYTTLGIDKTASQDDIKRAYRKLASKYHPDKGGDTQKFQEIQAAYDTLIDPEKRAQYDNPRPQFNQFGGMPPGFEDIFSTFGNMGPFGDMFGRARAQRNRNLSFQIQISLEDAFAGKNLTFSVRLPSGKEQIVDVKIPKGIQDGTTLRLANMGDDTMPNLPRGDIHLTIHLLPHNIFARHGDDLIYNLDVSAFDAILGKSYNIETLDKKLLEVKVKPGTQPDTIMAIHGYGMPNINDNRFVGRLLIKVNIKIPTDLTEQQLNKLRTL